jgi:Zn-finger nucleic acid-binding protein
MNCENCGAVMTLDVSGRFFQCRYCGTLHFPEPIDAEGIRIVGRSSGSPRCPVCHAGMDQAVLDQSHPVSFCGRCRGVLMPRTTFASVLNKWRAWATGPVAEPAPLNRRALDRALLCPSCGARMTTEPYAGPGNVVIDSCAACDLIWLDFGEMRQMVDAPGRDRGTRERIAVETSHIAPTELRVVESTGNPLQFLFDLLSSD